MVDSITNINTTLNIVTDIPYYTYRTTYHTDIHTLHIDIHTHHTDRY